MNFKYLLIICKPVPILNTKQTSHSLYICPKYKQIRLFVKAVVKTFTDASCQSVKVIRLSTV